jgi:hypothetical protein
MAAQLALDERWTDRPRPQIRRAPQKPVLCAGCQAREARYGFRPDTDDPLVERSRTLCFECFRAEIGRRQEAAQAIQVRLPLPPHRAGVRDGGPGLPPHRAGVRDGDPGLEQTLESLSRRRRRAQIAARRALELS